MNKINKLWVGASALALSAAAVITPMVASNSTAEVTPMARTLQFEKMQIAPKGSATVTPLSVNTFNAPMMAPGDGGAPVFVGWLNNDARYAASVTPCGMYAVDINSERTQLTDDFCGQEAVFLSGASKEGDYYAIKANMAMGMLMDMSLITFDGFTWEVKREIRVDPNVSFIYPFTMTYNPADGKFWGVAYNDDSTGCEIITIDFEAGTKTVIAPVSGVPFLAFYGIAATGDGTMYALGENGDLYSISLQGEMTRVGSTGMTPYYLQDIAYDFQGKQLYWWYMHAAEDLSHSDGIYRIDTQTAEATLVGQHAAGSQQWYGVTSLIPYREEHAPNAATSLVKTFDKDSHSGTLDFTLPTTYYNGDAFTGTVDYDVYFDGEIVKTASGTAGAKVSVPVSTERGMHSAKVVTRFGEQQGLTTRMKDFFVGKDDPGKIARVAAVKNQDGTVSVTWEAMTKGAHDGYVDPAEITYNVMRSDREFSVDNTSATSVTDPGKVNHPRNLTYTVTATDGTYTSEPTTSEKIQVGDRITLPYYRDFSDGDEFDFYTIVMPEMELMDQDSWRIETITDGQYNILGYTATFPITGVGTEDAMHVADDWLITPAFPLKAGKKYRFVMEADGFFKKNTTPTTDKHVEVKLGESNAPEDMTVSLIEPMTLPESRGIVDAWITPETDGEYYIGFHAIGDAWNSRFNIYNIRVEEAVEGAAPALPEFSGFKAVNEGNSLELTLTTPTKTVDGVNLGSGLTLTVRNENRGETVSTQTVTAGQTLTVTDSHPIEGVNRYAAYVSNASGPGLVAYFEGFAGPDTPEAPANVHFLQDGEDAILTWEAPAVGRNGGYVNPADLTYDIVMLAPVQGVIAEKVTGTTFTHKDVSALLGGNQNLVQYTVAARNEAGPGLTAASNTWMFGEPYTDGYEETFSNGQPTAGPWAQSNAGTASFMWTTTSSDSYDNDGGAMFGTAWSRGTSQILSPQISLEGLESPVISFAYKVEDANHFFNIYVSNDGAFTAEPQYVTTVNGQWASAVVDLSEFKDENIIIMFEAVADAPSRSYMYLDAIRVRDAAGADVAAASITASGAKAGMLLPVNFKLQNMGADTAEGLQVNISLDGVSLATLADLTLEGNASIDRDLTVSVPTDIAGGKHTLSAEVLWMEDGNPANNTATTDLNVVGANGPAPTDFAAAEEGENLLLTWTAPVIEEVAGSEITEGFEDIELYSLGGITDQEAWGSFGMLRAYDANRFKTFGIPENYNYPNARQQNAGQVLDSETCGWFGDVMMPHSGNQFLALFGSNDGYNAWLITPELGSNEFEFWAKSIQEDPDWDPEVELAVKYSTTTDDPEAFQTLEDYEYVTVPAEGEGENGYTKYTVTLPEGAKYAAIHLNAYEGFCLLIDDVKFTSAKGETPVLVGYNVWRDSEILNAEPLSETTFTTTQTTGTYAVSAVYGQYASPLSNTAYYEYTVDPSLNVVVFPEEGEVKTLMDIKFTFPDAEVVGLDRATNWGMENLGTLKKDDAQIVTFGEEHFGYLDEEDLNVYHLYLPQEYTEMGTYTVFIPEGVFGFRKNTEYTYSSNNRDITLTYRITESGVELLEVDGRDVQYYNMQGLPVDSGYRGIVIRVEGQKASKIVR